jgi:predicted alpha/beta hydrolase
MKCLQYLLTTFLFACLLDLSYGYYQFVRWVAMVGFAVLAYDYHGPAH